MGDACVLQGVWPGASLRKNLRYFYVPWVQQNVVWLYLAPRRRRKLFFFRGRMVELRGSAHLSKWLITMVSKSPK